MSWLEHPIERQRRALELDIVTFFFNLPSIYRMYFAILNSDLKAGKQKLRGASVYISDSPLWMYAFHSPSEDRTDQDAAEAACPWRNQNVHFPCQITPQISTDGSEVERPQRAGTCGRTVVLTWEEKTSLLVIVCERTEVTLWLTHCCVHWGRDLWERLVLQQFYTWLIVRNMHINNR